MTENILETIRKGVQDFVAPEVRQIKADVGALGAKVDALDSKFESKFDAMNSKFDARFDALHYEFIALWPREKRHLPVDRFCRMIPTS